MTKFMEKRTAIYARSSEDVEKLKKFCASHKSWQVREYVGQAGFRGLLQDVRRENVNRVVVNGLDQFPCSGAAALLKRLGYFADQKVVWRDVKNDLSTGDVEKFIRVLRQRDARKEARTPTSGRGRPREHFDLEKAVRLRETGAPYWFIQERLQLNVSVSTLSRTLRSVKPRSKRPHSYWSAKFRDSDQPDSWKLRALLLA